MHYGARVTALYFVHILYILKCFKVFIFIFTKLINPEGELCAERSADQSLVFIYIPQTIGGKNIE